MAAKSAKQKEPASFEEGLRELEEITGRMEAGVPLDESLQLYERGTFLARHCQHRLDAAEKQIETLSRSADGKLVATPQDAADDD